MDSFKIENFSKAYSTGFPHYVSLSLDDRKKVIEQIYNALNTTASENNIFTDIAESLNSSSFYVEDSAQLNSIIAKAGFSFKEAVLIIWRDNSIDQLSGFDLIKYWDDIWYDIGDEAVILFSSDTKVYC